MRLINKQKINSRVCGPIAVVNLFKLLGKKYTYKDTPWLYKELYCVVQKAPSLYKLDKFLKKNFGNKVKRMHKYIAYNQDFLDSKDYPPVPIEIIKKYLKEDYIIIVGNSYNEKWVWNHAYVLNMVKNKIMKHNSNIGWTYKGIKLLETITACWIIKK